MSKEGQIYTENILDKYQVKFSTPVGYPLHNRIDTVNEYLSWFIGDHNSVIRVNGLLNGINDIINSIEESGGGFDTQSMCLAIVNNSTTKIYSDMDDYYNNPDFMPSFVLPTSDFKEIVQAWLKYVSNSPTTV